MRVLRRKRVKEPMGRVVLSLPRRILTMNAGLVDDAAVTALVSITMALRVRREHSVSRIIA